jgi:hypothetical protein
LLEYFEGLDSERGIAWRAADLLAIRSFLGLGLSEAAPDHSTISRTRRLIDMETHQQGGTSEALAGTVSSAAMPTSGEVTDEKNSLRMHVTAQAS